MQPSDDRLTPEFLPVVPDGTREYRPDSTMCVTCLQPNVGLAVTTHPKSSSKESPGCVHASMADPRAACRKLAEDLQCGVCLTLPEGEVHQCNEGHCYCVTCWRALDPRYCPECRQPIQYCCRSRAQEARIAALEATCDHCAEVTTRGAMAAHLRACPQRPTACVGAEAGCGWSGMAAGQAAHEAACPIAVRQWMMAPLQARCDGLQAQNAHLVGSDEGQGAPWHAPPSNAVGITPPGKRRTIGLAEREAQVAAMRSRCSTRSVVHTEF